MKESHRTPPQREAIHRATEPSLATNELGLDGAATEVLVVAERRRRLSCAVQLEIAAEVPPSPGGLLVAAEEVGEQSGWAGAPSATAMRAVHVVAGAM